MQRERITDTSKHKKLLHLGIVNLILLVLIVVSMAIVFNIAVFRTENTKPDKILCITPNEPTYTKQTSSSEETSLTENTENSSDSSQKSSFSLSAPDETNNQTNADNNLGLNISDNDVTWHTETQINIFEHNDAHVKSDGTGNANHVIAPGTSNDYIFTLQNDKNSGVKYQLEISGGNDSEYKIPLSLSIIDPDGKNLLGNEPVTISDLETITQIGTLSGNSEKPYTIKWAWDFENGTDDYDTLLGNTAVDQEIPCHINLNVVAEYDDTPATDGSNITSDESNSSGNGNNNHFDEDGGFVLTGDNTNVIIYIIVSTLCLTAIVLIVLINKKQKKNDSL